MQPLACSATLICKRLLVRPSFLPSQVHTCVPNDAKGHVVVVRTTVAYESIWQSASDQRCGKDFDVVCRLQESAQRNIEQKQKAWDKGLPHKMDRMRPLVQYILARCCRHSSLSLKQPSGPYLAIALLAAGLSTFNPGRKHVVLLEA